MRSVHRMWRIDRGVHRVRSQWRGGLLSVMALRLVWIRRVSAHTLRRRTVVVGQTQIRLVGIEAVVFLCALIAVFELVVFQIYGPAVGKRFLAECIVAA